MAKAGSCQFALLMLDGFDLLPSKVQGFAHKIGVVLEKTDGLGDCWDDHTPTGLRRLTVAQTGAYFTTNQGSMHDAMKATPLTPRVLQFSPGAGQFYACKTAYVSMYEVLAKDGALTRANAQYVTDGPLTEGQLAQPPTTRTASWVGPVVDGGKSTTTGFRAAQQITAIDPGVSLVGVLEHSSDGIAFTPLATFPAATAVGALTQTGSGTVNRYTRFSGTVTGTGSVRVFASLVRTGP